jgi:anthranilate phosphoribosyltransferase
VPPEDFAQYVATLGRGPGKSRALTRDEARQAFAMVLAGEADPHQVGAFLMLLRFRGEDADEVAGLVEAAQATLPAAPAADLDWPSYGAGRTRGAPWFLLAALALGQAGIRVLMHGTNEFGTATPVAEALAALGMSPARGMEEAAQSLDRGGFAYLPVGVLSPALHRLLALRPLFGLRSPVNTAARLLDPARAPAGVDGVFHPAYLDVHLRVAERLRRPRLLVLKGGGGEAERVPAKPGTAHLRVDGAGCAELALPACDAAAGRAPQADPSLFAQVWRGEAAPARDIATVRATIALGLLGLGRASCPDAAEMEAARIWAGRKVR